MNPSITLLFIFFLIACSKENAITTDIPQQETTPLYFPPLNNKKWEKIAPKELDWNTLEISSLFRFLKNNNTRAFLILKDGKIVIEKYFGTNASNNEPFDKNSKWYWASAGKVITSTLTGIAQQEGFLNIDNPTSDYLGEGWINLPAEKEQLITVKNQLTMTTGLDYNVPNSFCTLSNCLRYKSDAGQQWYYHNAPYTLITKVIENATQINYNQFTNQKLEKLTGMRGQWRSQGFNTTYWSTARDMARFGLLMLNKGTWNTTKVLSDANYYNQMINSSQNFNPSYGYLWWLNGKTSIILPSSPKKHTTSLSLNAPNDLYAGLGKNGQFVEVIPSMNLVVVRMGEASGGLVPIEFHDKMWEKINLVIQ